MQKDRRLALVALSALAAAPRFALSQSWPVKPIQFLIPSQVGGSADFIGRLVADKLAQRVGQPVIVLNRPGAGAMVGAAEFTRMPADGHAIMFGGNSIVTTNPALFKQLTYDPKKDFAPVTIAVEIPTALVARNGLGASSIPEVLRLARARPGGISIAYGSSTAQVAAVMLAKEGGVQLNLIPYKGEPEGLRDLLGNQVDLLVVNVTLAFDAIKDGRLTALGLAGSRRMDTLPTVPLISEMVAGFNVPAGWIAFWVRSGTPPAFIERLNRELVSILELPDVKQRILGISGHVMRTTTPAEMQATSERDAVLWAELIRTAKIEPQ